MLHNLKKKKAILTNHLNFENLLYGIMETFHEILRKEAYQYGLTEEELMHRIEFKKLLRQSLRNCALGDHGAKLFILDYIKDFLVKKYDIRNETIEYVLPFSDSRKLDAETKFLILLYSYEREFKKNGLSKLLLEHHLDQPKRNEEDEIYYEITPKDIHYVYDSSFNSYLSYNDKLNLLSQKLYERYRGNGVIDMLCQMDIDGISAGVSGLTIADINLYSEDVIRPPASYDSIWIFLNGISIHLSFLSFKSNQEFIRVCKNIYRYRHQGQLSETMGYTVTEMMDGSRASVARPPFCESWILIIRKFNHTLQEDIDKLITDENSILPIEILRWIIKGCQITGITGEQGVGKTSLLIALISFISPHYNLRIQELSFELHLRRIYPKRNIISFQETESISGQEGLDFQKKTDGAIAILGEVSSAAIASWLIQMSQTASVFTLFTHHATSTENLIAYLRNSLLQEGGFSNEQSAMEQVIDAVRFDVHMAKDEMGHRYIERISEICKNEDGDGKNFVIRDLLIYENGKYVMKKSFSDLMIDSIFHKLTKTEGQKFLKQLRDWRYSYC